MSIGRRMDPPNIHGPLDDDDIAALEAYGAEMERFGESIWLQGAAEHEIKKTTKELARWRSAVTRTETTNPNEPRLHLARTAIAELEGELSHWRFCFLKAWRSDHRAN